MQALIFCMFTLCAMLAASAPAPTNLIRHCFLEQTAAWVEIYVNILKGTLAQKFICAGSDVKLAPLIIFNLFANQDPKRTLKGLWIFFSLKKNRGMISFTHIYKYIAGLFFSVLSYFLMLLHAPQPRHFFLGSP